MLKKNGVGGKEGEVCNNIGTDFTKSVETVVKKRQQQKQYLRVAVLSGKDYRGREDHPDSGFPQLCPWPQGRRVRVQPRFGERSVFWAKPGRDGGLLRGGSERQQPQTELPASPATATGHRPNRHVPPRCQTPMANSRRASPYPSFAPFPAPAPSAEASSCPPIA